MKVTVIPVVISALGTIPKGLVKGIVSLLLLSRILALFEMQASRVI